MIRYALCGTSNRGIGGFLLPLLGVNGEEDATLGYGASGEDYRDVAEVTALVDKDLVRAQAVAAAVKADLPAYGPDQLDEVLANCDCLIVATPDHTHLEYALAAVEAGVEVIVEKPVTTTAADGRRLLEAAEANGVRVRVAHNLRYAPKHLRLMEMIQQGAIGRVTQIEYQHRVDTRHGAGYFLRWNRERARSGGLSVHKPATTSTCCSGGPAPVPRWSSAAAPATSTAPTARTPPPPSSPGARTPTSGRRATATPSSLATASGPGCSASPTRWSIRSRSRCGSMTRPSTSRTPTAPSSGTPAASRRPIPSTSPHPGRAPPSASPAPPGDRERTGRLADGSPLPQGEYAWWLPLFGEPQPIEVPAVSENGHGGADGLMRADLFRGATGRTQQLGASASLAEAVDAVAAGEAIWRSAASGDAIRID